MGSPLLLTLKGFSHLAHPLRLLVIRLCRLCFSASRIAPALRSWSAWLWKSLLTFAARHRAQPRIRLLASDAPAPVVGSNTITLPEVEPATLPPARAVTPTPLPGVDWHKILSRLRERTPGNAKQYILEAATPEGGSQRYNPKTAKGLPSPDDFRVPVGQKALLSSLPSFSKGWRRYVHPEGVVLFYHEEFRIFTERDVEHLSDDDILACAAELIEKAIEAPDVTLDDLTHIVLNVDVNGIWYYYFVDHTNRLLFWVDEVTARQIKIDLRGIHGYNHIKYMVEAYYWYATFTTISIHECYMSHCEYYPHDRVLPTQAFADLRGMLNYAKIDVLTTDSSSSPFGQDELAAMLGLLDSLKDVSEISDPYSIWAIARLMAYFTENQFMDFYGQPCARLNADNALFGKEDWIHQYWFAIINVFLLSSPKEHALRLQRVWVDGVIIQPRWKDFINRLTTEWTRYTIFSTVMLAVNFSFLALPNVSTSDPIARAIQTIIYCSIVSTVASIVFSFGLLNVYSNPRLLIAGNALNAMWRLSQTKKGVGMACLAVTHCLPIASLIWSIVLFSFALALQIFGARQLATVSTLAVEYVIIAMFVIMGVFVLWEFSKNEDEDDVMDIPPEKGTQPLDDVPNTPRDVPEPDLEEGEVRVRGRRAPSRWVR